MREVGIWIDLPESEYFNSDCIGGSSLKDLIPGREAEWWWASSNNPVIKQMMDDMEDKPERRDGKMFGKALHKGVLEGIEAFKSEYALDFDPSQYPDALNTADDLKGWIRVWNEENSDDKLALGGKKEDLVARIMSVSDDVQIMDALKQEYEAENEGKAYIKKIWYDYILLFAKITSIDPYISELVSEGVPELSVFWKEEGVPCRMRIDWFRKGGVVDLKSFSAWSGRSIRQACLSNIKKYRYDLQEAHYRRGIVAMKDLPIHGGAPEQRAYIKDALKGEFDFTFLFYKSIGAPITRKATTPSLVLDVAYRERETCFERWRQFYTEFGLDTPWMTACEDIEITDDDFHQSFGT